MQAEEVRRQELEKKMMKSGLNVVWKMGKLMLEERCRRICEIMMSGVDKDRSKVESLAHALIQASLKKNLVSSVPPRSVWSFVPPFAPDPLYPRYVLPASHPLPLPVNS